MPCTCRVIEFLMSDHYTAQPIPADIHSGQLIPIFQSVAVAELGIKGLLEYLQK